MTPHDEKFLRARYASQSELVELCIDSDPDVRAAAACRMENQTLLEKLAKDDPDSTVRYVAVSRLNNIDLLQEIKQNGKDGTWFFAIRRLKELGVIT
jgi:hypothetical protein